RHGGDGRGGGGPDVRRDAVELGPELHRWRGARVQVPGKPRRRRGRLHPADGVVDDRPGVLLRRPRPSDYRLFGIRYLILPAGGQPPVRARLAMRSAPYWLWRIHNPPWVPA